MGKWLKAKKARKIAIDSVIYKIEKMAQDGRCIYKHFEYLSDECIEELKKLGYKVEENKPTPDEYNEGNYMLKYLKDYEYVITW